MVSVSGRPSAKIATYYTGAEQQKLQQTFEAKSKIELKIKTFFSSRVFSRVTVGWKFPTKREKVAESSQKTLGVPTNQLLA